MAREALERLKTLRAPQVLAVVGTHLAMIAMVAWGGYTYLMLHVLLALELVLVNVFTAAFYRRWKQHLLDVVRSSFLMALLLVLLFAGWMLLVDGPGPALEFGFPAAGAATLGWASAYVAAHVALTAVQCGFAPEPRLAWLRAVSADGAASVLSAVAMVFLTIIAGMLLGGEMSPGFLATALAITTIVVRLPIVLLASTITDAEQREAARDPWKAMER